MKKTILSFLAGGLVLLACGQKPTPPKEVEAAFSKKFKEARNPLWEQEDNEWEAEFKLNGKEMSASFNNLGNWLETETEIKKKDVPVDIFKAVNLRYSDWEMEEIERVEKPDFKGYEIELEKGETETEILITDSGEITVKKQEAEDDD